MESIIMSSLSLRLFWDRERLHINKDKEIHGRKGDVAPGLWRMNLLVLWFVGAIPSSNAHRRNTVSGVHYFKHLSLLQIPVRFSWECF
jgi:hypothetical protein